MARVVAFVPDLLFGSNVVSALRGAGQQPELVAELGPDLQGVELLIVDLTAEPAERIDQVRRLRPTEAPVLAFYSHVEADVRRQAEEAGFELVVPRSRMAREGAALAMRLLSGR